MNKVAYHLQWFKQPPEPNSGFSPKAQEIGRRKPPFLIKKSCNKVVTARRQSLVQDVFLRQR